MIQCTNPAAINYDPTATEDDGSCLYLKNIDGVCHAFRDVNPDTITDKSYTLSWSIAGNNWVFFHDYIADFYFSTREQLYSLKDNRIYKHNSGPVGSFYDKEIKPFFIDVAFGYGNMEATLNTIEWISEVLNTNGTVAQKETLTHITAWNSRQCTGRVPLSSVFNDLMYETHRKTQGKWSFSDFRDKVRQEGLQFLQDIFNNFAVVDTALSDSIPWYEQQLLEDNYFIVRFEFDNISGKTINLHSTGVNTQQSVR